MGSAKRNKSETGTEKLSLCFCYCEFLSIEFHEG